MGESMIQAVSESLWSFNNIMKYTIGETTQQSTHAISMFSDCKPYNDDY